MPIYEFTTRRPSKAQVIAKVKQGLAITNKSTVVWGENELTVTKVCLCDLGKPEYRHTGEGWIGPIGGQDIADELNKGARA